MVEEIRMIPQKDKKGNVYQKAIVDFRQDVHSDAAEEFFRRIIRGQTKVPCERRNHYWKVHFVPRPRTNVMNNAMNNATPTNAMNKKVVMNNVVKIKGQAEEN